MQFGHLIQNFQLFSTNHAHILLSSLLYISQLILYARASTLYDDFLSRSCLTSKLMGQGYERFKLISAFKKFYGRNKILVDRYKVSVTHIISDLFLEALYRSWLACYYGGLLWMFECILIYPFLQWVKYKFRWGRPFLVTLLKGGGWLMRALFVRRRRPRPHLVLLWNHCMESFHIVHAY